MVNLGFVIGGLGFVGWTLYSLTTGEIDIVWARFGVWASLKTTADRDEQPLLFWGAVISYCAMGLLLAGFGGYQLFLHRH